MGGFKTKKALLENTSRYAIGITDSKGRRIKLIPYRGRDKLWRVRLPKKFKFR